MIYTVKPGDSLSKIAIKFYGDMARWPEIATANQIQNPDLIAIGMPLIIPGLQTLQPEQDYIYPSSATTALPSGFTRNAAGELVIPITGSTQTAPKQATLVPAGLLGMLRNPWMLAAAGLVAFLALQKPRRRTRRSRRRR